MACNLAEYSPFQVSNDNGIIPIIIIIIIKCSFRIGTQ